MPTRARDEGKKCKIKYRFVHLLVQFISPYINLKIPKSAKVQKLPMKTDLTSKRFGFEVKSFDHETF